MSLCLSQSLQKLPAASMCLATYPNDPRHLSADHLAAAYDGNQVPAGQDFPTLATIILHHVWVRSTASALSKVLGY